MIELHMIAFEPIIKHLHDYNVVIGGAAALQLHGLELPREPKDLDLIIFTPTQKQKDVLNHLSVYDVAERPNNEYFNGEEEPNWDWIKIMKFKKSGFTLDIILAKEGLPHGLLETEFNKRKYRVNSIKNVIAAKNSYRFTQQKHDELKTYCRLKDLQDLIELKNLNFNP